MITKEELMARCPDCGAEPPDWHEKTKTKTWQPGLRGPRWHCERCDAYRILQDEGEAHMPVQEDDVDKWLCQVQDEFYAGGLDLAGVHMATVIEEYRSLAKRGVTLAERRSTHVDRKGP